MSTPLKLFIFPAIFLSCHLSYSQMSTVEEIKKKYEVVTRQISGLYNGPKYQPDPVLYDEGTPFLYSYLQPGTVEYDGKKYTDTELLYDLVKDELVLIHYNGSARIQLIKSKVETFTIGEKNFIHVKGERSKDWGINEGYYEVIYKGKDLLLKKHLKVLQTSYTSHSGRVDVFDRQKFYLVRNGKANQISNRKSFLSLLGKTDIDSKLRKSGITFRANQEEYMKQALQQTEQPD